MTLLEPDVALTDLGLAVEAGCFAAWLQRRYSPGAPLRLAFVGFFAAVALAAFLGGFTHGFLPDEQAQLYRAVWLSTLIAIGAAALASWAIGARLIFGERTADRVIAFAALLFAAYIAAIIFVSRSFAVAIVHYLPAAAFLLFAFAYAWRRRRSDFLAAGIAGVALTFVAAAVQQGRIGVHPRYFNHNALYHLIQASALLLIFLAARGLLKPAAR
jgi:Family of unknown function (DUF6962)